MLKLIQEDPWLEPYSQDVQDRYDRFVQKLKDLGGLEKVSYDHKKRGLFYDQDKKSWMYKEWAPNAEALYLIGDFNNWEHSHPLMKLHDGTWGCCLEDNIFPNQKYKVAIESKGFRKHRIPAFANYVVQDSETLDFAASVYPKSNFKWTDQDFDLAKITSPLIYEAHVGMGLEKEGVGTWKEFAEKVLPRIQKLGYNCIQLMAVQEHPYYGSFGYHVSNFYAPSSRFGSPDDLRFLVNKAHNMGISVIMDLVHSHAVKNEAEGLTDFDGSSQYFHEGDRGHHPAWDSKLFDYGKTEVVSFLLSNIRYWLEEFHFDGFRFDGVTSMLYHHHGLGVDFDHYDKYFKDGVEWDAITYLQLANTLIHEIKPNAISIAEDMSGMPGICRSVDEGGLGFDYRLAMGIPDYWIKLLKHKPDEDWDINEIWEVLNNRRAQEKTISYAESHDQALVGDKTIAFWLMDKEMYFSMSKSTDSLIVDRGIALHKMIRIISLALGGDGYLNFIGNEFGHPEWIDFPREGNGWSYKHACRKWSLVDNTDLKYEHLNNFDTQMIHLIKDSSLYSEDWAEKLNVDESNKVLIFKRGNLTFVFNFSPQNSIPDYEFFVPEAGAYNLVLNSDENKFGGFDRVDSNAQYHTFEKEGINFLKIYTVSRSVLVFKKA